MKNEKPPFRGVIFGMNRFGVHCIVAPKEAEDCGLYVHVDDIEKYEEWQKAQDSEPESEK